MALFLYNDGIVQIALNRSSSSSSSSTEREREEAKEKAIEDEPQPPLSLVAINAYAVNDHKEERNATHVSVVTKSLTVVVEVREGEERGE
jgi:hypothetical protein